MAGRSLILSGGRRLVLGSLDTPIDHSFRQPFAALVPAFNEKERQKVGAIVDTLLDEGCIELCCVGPQAEQLHDSLDGIVEARGMLDVVTTWHSDYADACEYFLFAAGRKPPTLLALIAPHSELVALLEQQAATT